MNNKDTTDNLDKKQKFINLYIELCKIRQDSSFNSHIKLNDTYKIYAYSEILVEYIMYGNVLVSNRSHYISFDRKVLNSEKLICHYYYNEDFYTFIDEILEVMRSTLADWKVLFTLNSDDVLGDFRPLVISTTEDFSDVRILTIHGAELPLYSMSLINLRKALAICNKKAGWRLAVIPYLERLITLGEANEASNTTIVTE